jgi:taurine dioxygenase
MNESVRTPTGLNIAGEGGTLGATVTGIDLANPITDAQFADVLRALGDHGVLCFPNQPIGPQALRVFSARFGQLQVTPIGQMPGLPDVSILSNIVEGGSNIGIPDAGQDWHTDMTYNPVPGFVNVLVAQKVPMRDGQPLGSTEFANAQAACAALPDDLLRRLEGLTAVHDINKFWEHMRRERGSTRASMTPEQRAKHPPSIHPVLLTHPITGRKVLYVNPGFTERIEQLSQDESDQLLEQLYAQVLQPQFRYVHRWTVGDLLLWDHIGTWHTAVADYQPTEHRLMIRCQVMADRIFDPAFTRAALATA